MKIETKTFRIEGMSCASCVKRVETALAQENGVETVSVNLASETASVRFDAEKVKLEQLQLNVARVGYRLIPKDLRQKINWWAQHEDLVVLFASTILSLPLVLPMITPLWGSHWRLSPLAQLLLTIPVQFILGRRFYLQTWRAIKNRSLNMDVLVVVGTTSAFGLSVYLGFFSDPIAAQHLYFESSAVIITLVLLGKYLEKRAKQKTTEALRALESLRPETATLIKNGEENVVPIFKVLKGNQLLIKPGERIPVDGTVMSGTTTIDESLITGESLPINKSVNDAVVSGSLNIDGLITIEARSIEAESMLSQIIQMMEDAHQKKAPIEKLVDRVSEVFVPTVIMIALLTLLIWRLLGYGWEPSLINAIAVLVIACPCALGLATPTALMVGRGMAARKGILIKDAEALEKAYGLRAIIFDKTGTLTEGQPQLVSTQLPVGDASQSETALLRLAYGVQRNNTHPLAKAVVSKAIADHLTPPEFSNIRILPGKGSEGVLINGEVIQIGSQAWMRELGYDTSLLSSDYGTALKQGYSTAWIANASRKKILGFHTFMDAIRPAAASAIQALQHLGLQTILLSGDKKEVAELVATQLKIPHVIAEVLPKDKLQHLLTLRAQWGSVAMVGDGINDAPALAAADLGIAMGSGTDVAIGAATITLLRNDPLQVVDAIHIARSTYLKIKQNLFWAFIYNIVGIPLAALGLLNPMLAAAAMAFSSVSVVSNSLLLGSAATSRPTNKGVPFK